MSVYIYQDDGTYSGGGSYVSFIAWGGGGGGGEDAEGAGGGGGGAKGGITIKTPTGTYDIEIGVGGAPGVDGGDTVISRLGVEILRVPGGKAGSGRTGGDGGSFGPGGGFASPGNDGGSGGSSTGDDAGGGGGGGAPPQMPYGILIPGILFEPPSFMNGDNNSGGTGGAGGGYSGDGAAFGGAGGTYGAANNDGEDGQGFGAGGGGGSKGQDSGSGRSGRVIVIKDMKVGHDCCCAIGVCTAGSQNEEGIVMPAVIHANINVAGDNPFSAMIAAGNPYTFKFAGFRASQTGTPNCCAIYTLQYGDESASCVPDGFNFEFPTDTFAGAYYGVKIGPSPIPLCSFGDGTCETYTHTPLDAYLCCQIAINLAPDGGWRMSSKLGIACTQIIEHTCTFAEDCPACEESVFCNVGFIAWIQCVYGEGYLSDPTWNAHREMTAERGNSTSSGDACMRALYVDDPLQYDFPEEVSTDVISCDGITVVDTYTFTNPTLELL